MSDDARTDAYNKGAMLVDETKQALTRYDVGNPDLTFDPFDTLRQLCNVFEVYETVMEEMERQLEGNKELFDERLSNALKELQVLRANQARLAELPWIRPYLVG